MANHLKQIGVVSSEPTWQCAPGLFNLPCQHYTPPASHMQAVWVCDRHSTFQITNYTSCEVVCSISNPNRRDFMQVVAGRAITSCVIPEIGEYVQRLSQMTRDEKIAELRNQLELTRERIAVLVAVVMDLESENIDWLQFRSPIIPFLRMAAAGQIIPEAIERYQDDLPQLRTISRLPTPEQKKLLVDHGLIKIVREDEEVIAKGIDELTASDRRAVFKDGRIRSVQEQKQRQKREVKPVKVVALSLPSEIKVHKQGRYIEVGSDKIIITLDQLCSIVSYISKR